jgi:hypothetical protein
LIAPYTRSEDRDAGRVRRLRNGADRRARRPHARKRTTRPADDGARQDQARGDQGLAHGAPDEAEGEAERPAAEEAGHGRRQHREQTRRHARFLHLAHDGAVAPGDEPPHRTPHELPEAVEQDHHRQEGHQTETRGVHVADVSRAAVGFPMRLHAFDAVGLRALEAALRAEEPVQYTGGPDGAAPLDELVPLCHGVDDPRLARWLPPAARGGTGLAVSAVIPTHRQRPIGLAALAGQDVDVEVIVLANGGWTEGVPVPWEGHGATRQRGVALARHPWVLFTVDDARVLGAGMVRTMVEALEEGGYDAVVARQLPWPTASAATRARLRAWTPPGDAPVDSPILDNVCALYRRQALLDDPFDPVPIAEDWLWGRRHRIGYVPTAPVLHSHPRRLRASYARTRDEHAVRIGAGEAPAVPDTAALLRGLPSVVGRDLRGALGELLGQYAASRQR